MSTVKAILADLESAIASHSEDQKAQTMIRVTDLFLARADEYSDDQVSVFDVVIGRLAAGVDVKRRVELAERLADLIKAPHGVVRQLALDELIVARPVLTRSSVLTEQDLIAVASTKGRDHMLAITERPHLTETVTDYLVVKGDRVISTALAKNEGARFSKRGMGLLVTRAFADESLQTALGAREDVPADLMVNLSKATRDSARRRLMTRTAPAALLSRAPGAPGAPEAPSETDGEARKEAAALVAALAQADKLDEPALAAFAAQGKLDEAVCALATMVQVSTAAAEQSLLGADRDACLVLGKAMGWGWDTVKLLLSLRPEADNLPHLVARSRSNYESLSQPTAQRVLQFMRVKDQMAKPA
jgi:uncharacterized protein (DUF2336 family)